MTTSYFRRIHPLTAAAAVSLTLFSLLGIGAITGLITPAQRMATQPAAATSAAAGALAAQPKAPQVADAVAPRSPVDSGIVHTTPPAQPRAKILAQNHGPNPATTAASGAKACGHCGEVAAIDLVKQDGEANGLGAIAGGVAGGVVGNQIGKDKGNILMTILGAGGGAYIGHSIEQKAKGTTAYLVKVAMNDGSIRTVALADKPSFGVGDQVKVINGGLSVIS